MPNLAIEGRNTLENPRCYYCSEEIWFHPKFEHDNGTPIPLDIERDFSGQIVEHLCTPRKLKLLERRFTKCYRCNDKITFDKSIRSKTGVLVPCEYNKDTNRIERHICRKMPGYRHSLMQRRREQERLGIVQKSPENDILKREIEDWKFKERWR